MNRFCAIVECCLSEVGQEFEQHLCGRVGGQAKVGVELVVGCLPGAKHFGGKFGFFEHDAETSRQRGGVRVLGNMENQKWRDALGSL